ncbi:hypothetical protein KIN20_018213 [Parelaphostrongylus tenuis]|uniref:YEATS domain-containing protein n=1 Tax=Parelaphostrongylus tenuis TaxID=148309 RepID=A0AAD5N1Q1_PARTN|nr:hypothetical protein KIN20_018213 [Parelaphostrongylus tenuis]
MSGLLSKSLCLIIIDSDGLFVRPIIGSKLTDRTFINKVEIELHPTFGNPFRVLKEPPFELEETGYASFTPKLIIHFNTPHVKPYLAQYHLNLTLGKTDDLLSASDCFDIETL